MAAVEAAGFEVTWEQDTSGARRRFHEHAPDLALLDLGLPDGDGIALCRWIRDRRPDIPVIIVTARDAEIDVIVGLDAGASDYVTKPFSSEVLLARMRAQLRSTGRRPIGEVLESGPIRLDRAARSVTVDGRPVELRRREFDLLDLLGHNVMHQELKHAAPVSRITLPTTSLPTGTYILRMSDGTRSVKKSWKHMGCARKS